MKYLFSLISLSICINAMDIQYKGNIGIDYKNFNYSIPYVKDKEQKTFLSDIELKKDFENTSVFLKIELLKDLDTKSRKYTKVNEMYLKYESDNYDLKLGRDIKYWGALELYNITDVYNEKNIKNDSFDKDKKLGRDGLTYTYYTQDEDSISMIASKDKAQKNNLSSYIKYSGSRDDIGQRDFSYVLSTKDEKFFMFHSLVKNDTIYKLEYTYSNKNKTYQVGTGIEHTLYGAFDKKDLSLMLEYYKSNNKIVTYQKNIFLGVRMTVNDVSDSDMLFGLIKDNIKNEYSYSMQYNTRIINKFKTKVSYLKNDSLELVSINIAYYF